jgi:hypothetical protein
MTVLNEVEDTLSGFAEGEARQFRRIFFVTVIVFVPAIVVARLLPRSMRPWGSERGEQRSVIAEAKAAANAFLPFAFMG